MKDKDSREMLAVLSGIAEAFFFVPVDSPRSAEPAELMRSTAQTAKIFSSLTSAIDAATAEPAPVLITGSLFLAGEALSVLNPGFLRRES